MTQGAVLFHAVLDAPQKSYLRFRKDRFRAQKHGLTLFQTGAFRIVPPFQFQHGGACLRETAVDGAFCQKAVVDAVPEKRFERVSRPCGIENAEKALLFQGGSRFLPEFGVFGSVKETPLLPQGSKNMFFQFLPGKVGKLFSQKKGKAFQHLLRKISVAQGEPGMPEPVAAVEAVEMVVFEKFQKLFHEKVRVFPPGGKGFQGEDAARRLSFGSFVPDLGVFVRPLMFGPFHVEDLCRLFGNDHIEKGGNHLDPVLMQFVRKSPQVVCGPFLPFPLFVEASPVVGALQVAQIKVLFQVGVSVEDLGGKEKKGDEGRLLLHAAQKLLYAEILFLPVEADEFDPDAFFVSPAHAFLLSGKYTGKNILFKRRRDFVPQKGHSRGLSPGKKPFFH